jgi:hypothetical protein
VRGKMDRKKIILVCEILILAIISISAVKFVGITLLPLIRTSGIVPSPTFDPCKSIPYPIPTAIECPTATPGYNPYPGPVTITPSVTVTPIPQVNKYIFLPLIEVTSE